MLSAYHTAFSSHTRTTASAIDHETEEPSLNTTKMDTSQPDELNYHGSHRVGSEDTTTGIAKSGKVTGEPTATATTTSTPTKLRRSERRASMASSQLPAPAMPSSAPTPLNNEGSSSKSASPTKRQPVTLRLTMGKSQSHATPGMLIDDGGRAMAVSSEQPVATPRKRALPPMDDISSMMFIDFTPPSMDAGQSGVPLHTPSTFAQQQPTKIRLQFKEPSPGKDLDVSSTPAVLTESRKLKQRKSPVGKAKDSASGSIGKPKTTSPTKSANSTPAGKKTGSKVKPIRLTTSSTEPSPKKAKTASKNASPTKVSAKTDVSPPAEGRVGSPPKQLVLSLGSSANGSGSPNEDRPLTVKLRAGKHRPPAFKWTEFKTVGAELVTLRLPTDDEKPKKKSASSSKRSSPVKKAIGSSPSKNAARSPVKQPTASEAPSVNTKKASRSKGSSATSTAKPLKPISDETKQALKITVMKNVAAKTKAGSKSPSKASPKSKANKDNTAISSKSASPKSASKKATSSPVTKSTKQTSPLNEKEKEKEASPLNGEKKVKEKKQKKSPLKETEESGKRLRNKKSKATADATPKGLTSRQRKARLADEEAILAEDEELTNKKVDESGEMVNLEYCFACHGDGNLICCEGCPKSFHFTCTDPPIDPNEVPEEAWFCCECRYRREHNETLPSFPSSTTSMEQLYGYLIEKVKSMNPKAFVLPKRLRKTADKDSASLANNLSFVGPKSGSLQSMNDSQGTLHYSGFYHSANASETSQLHHMSHAPHHIEQFSGPGTSPSLENVAYLGGGHSAVTPRHKERTTDDGACFACNRGAPSAHRLLIKCDQCTLLWHLDCLPYPLAVYPSSRRAWSCPLHLNSIENLVDLSPDTASRVARTAAVTNIPVDSWNITPSLRTPALKTGPHLIPEQSLRLTFGMTSSAAILLQKERKKEGTYTGCRVPDIVKTAYEQVRTLI